MLIQDTTALHSEFLRFATKDDKFRALAGDNTFNGISFLRIEMMRVRSGMQDFITKVSTPAIGDSEPASDPEQPSGDNTVLTLRCNRRHASAKGLNATAKVIVAEMVKRGDKTTEWEKVDSAELARLIASSLKFFATNTNTMLLHAVTEAISV